MSSDTIQQKFDAVSNPITPTHLAYMLYEALPDNKYGSLKLLYSPQANEMQHFDSHELSARATSFYRFQLRHKAHNSEGSCERALATSITEKHALCNIESDEGRRLTVGYPTFNRTQRLSNLSDPTRITNSGESSFR